MFVQIMEGASICKVHDRKITDNHNDAITDKIIAINRFISAAIVSAEIGFFSAANTVPRRAFSLNKHHSRQLAATDSSLPRNLKRNLTGDNLSSESTVLNIKKISEAPMTTTSDSIPSMSVRTTSGNGELLANKCDDTQLSKSMSSTDCSIRARSHFQNNRVYSSPGVRMSLGSNCVESYDCPSFVGNTADIIGETLIIITSAKLSSSEMLILNDDASISSLKHFKSLWTGLSSNDVHLFNKSTRPSTTMLRSHSNLNIHHSINDLMEIPQVESQSLCSSKVGDGRRSTSSSDIAVEMAKQSDLYHSFAIIPYCEPLLTNFLGKNISRSRIAPEPSSCHNDQVTKF